jgi:hypothetical protein
LRRRKERRTLQLGGEYVANDGGGENHHESSAIDVYV